MQVVIKKEYWDETNPLNPITNEGPYEFRVPPDPNTMQLRHKNPVVEGSKKSTYVVMKYYYIVYNEFNAMFVFRFFILRMSGHLKNAEQALEIMLESNEDNDESYVGRPPLSNYDQNKKKRRIEKSSDSSSSSSDEEFQPSDNSSSDSSTSNNEEAINQAHGQGPSQAKSRWRKKTTQQQKRNIRKKACTYGEKFVLRYEKECQGRIKFKYSHDQPDFKMIETETRSKRGRPSNVASWKKLYDRKLPISSAKKKDLLSLCSARLIPDELHGFFDSNESERHTH
uniref:Uncharacterized protein n=1 Tax=Romanomermis culicivorax TaxID=13658 RepID=A0A915JL60_ROMCU